MVAEEGEVRGCPYTARRVDVDAWEETEENSEASARLCTSRTTRFLNGSSAPPECCSSIPRWLGAAEEAGEGNWSIRHPLLVKEEAEEEETEREQHVRGGQHVRNEDNSSSSSRTAYPKTRFWVLTAAGPHDRQVLALVRSICDG
jgi:hypothetical protein